MTVLACGSSVFALGAPGAAADVTCGQQISTPGTYTLGSDLNCAGSGGIGITVEGVTLDLNGHSISGPGSGSNGAGIAGISYLTAENSPQETIIENGTIQGFGSGLYTGGIVATGPVNVTLRHLVIRHNANGVLFESSPVTAKIFDNRITDNGFDAIAQQQGVDADVERNLIARNGGGISGSESNGVYRNNVITRNTGDGMSFFFCGCLIVHNVLSGNGGNGLSMFSPGAGCCRTYRVGGNVAVHNVGYGIYADFPSNVTDLGGNIAAGNGKTPQCVSVVCSPP